MSQDFQRHQWTDLFIRRPVLAIVVSLLILLLGLKAVGSLPVNQYPQTQNAVVTITTTYFGADPETIAGFITQPLEGAIAQAQGIDYLSSISISGISTITATLRLNYDANQALTQINTQISSVRNQLPPQAQQPILTVQVGQTTAAMYMGFYSDDIANNSITDYLLRVVKPKLDSINGVQNAEILGGRKFALRAWLDRDRMAGLGVAPDDVYAAMAANNYLAPVGSTKGQMVSVDLVANTDLHSLDEFRKLIIKRNGADIVYLDQVATVTLGSEDYNNNVAFNGKQSVFIGIKVAPDANLLDVAKRVRDAFPDIQKQLPTGLNAKIVYDSTDFINTSIQEVVQTLLEALIIVTVVIYLFLGSYRAVAVPVLAMPLSLIGTFFMMQVLGYSINLLTLLALVLAIGLVVDDAIIVVEMMVRKMEEGADRMRAATAAFELTAMPMLTGTLITAVGFLPIGIAKSVVGEYTFAIFAVTAAALMVSWVVSVFFVPVLGYWLLKGPNRMPSLKKHGVSPTDETAMAVTEDDLFNTPFYLRFRQAVTWCVFNPGKTLLATLLVFVLGVVGMGRVEQQFFPDSSRPEIMVDVWLPEGASVTASEEFAKRLERQAAQTEGVDTVTSWIGSGAPRFFLPLDIIFPQSNVAQLIVQPKEGASRAAILKSLQQTLPVLAPEARLRVKLLPNGPPVPYPVAFRLISERPEQAIEAASLVEAVMKTHPNLEGVHNNWNEKRPVAQLTLDLGRARELGVGASAVARTLEARFAGVSVGEFRENDKLIPIELRLPAAERDGLKDLRGLLVPSASGQQVPLEKIAKVELVWEHGMIWRRDRQYAVTVQGALTPGKQAPTVSAEVAEMLEPVKAKFPPGVRLEVGGEVEESSKGQSSIFAGVPIMLFITLTLLVIQLKSTPKSLMVLATAPLGIAGVAGALLLLGRPFGFVAMLGFIALMGMIMRNSVILIDQIEKERARGLGPNESIIEATVARFRPITLTAAAAVLAMIPLQGSVFWGPMAVAIMGGLVVATALTLLSLPALCAYRPQWPGFGARPWGKH